jgi:hypothetical protein
MFQCKELLLRVIVVRAILHQYILIAQFNQFYNIQIYNIQRSPYRCFHFHGELRSDWDCLGLPDIDKKKTFSVVRWTTN